MILHVKGHFYTRVVYTIKGCSIYVLNRMYYYFSHSKCQTVIVDVSSDTSARLHLNIRIGDELIEAPPCNTSHT